MFAFAASGDIGSLYLAGGLISYRNVLETEIYSEPLSNFAWNIFRVADLPDLAARSAPRRIHLAGAVDASVRPVAADAVRKMYASENVVISDEPAWDETALAGA